MNHERISHYEIGRPLGRGGMGEVYEAYDVRTRRKVALKFIASDRAADSATLQRFEAEAVNAAQMKHPHIATLYEFDPDAERPFIAMELVAGPTLRERIAQGPLPTVQVLEIGRDVGAALLYAHRRDVIHRDIKPENLMFDEEGRIKVMDFGLARGLLETRLTSTHTTVGTLSYMAPETLRGVSGPPADVFALGLVIVEMATGRRVFDGDGPAVVMFLIANQGAPPVRTLWPDAPAEVSDLIDGMLASKAEDRIDAATAAAELARLAGASPGVDPHAARRPRPKSPRTPVRLTPAVVAGLVMVVALAGLLALRRIPGRDVSPEQRQRAIALNNQAFQALDRGDLVSARGLAVAARKLDPGYGEAQLNIARIQTLQGQVDSATTTFQRLTRDKNQRVRFMAVYGLGDINLQSGSPDEAVRRFQESLAIDSTRREAINGLGLALVGSGRAREGLDVLQRGLERFPSEAALYKNAALACWKLQDATSALRYATQAIALEPGYGEALGLRARARAHLGDHAGAVQDWNAFVASGAAPADREETRQDLIAAGVAPEMLRADSH